MKIQVTLNRVFDINASDYSIKDDETGEDRPCTEDEAFELFQEQVGDGDIELDDGSAAVTFERLEG